MYRQALRTSAWPETTVGITCLLGVALLLSCARTFPSEQSGREGGVPTDLATGDLGDAGTLCSVNTVAVGTGHACAVDTAHHLFCWGSDEFGQLGDDTTLADKTAPTVVAGANDWWQVAAGEEYTCGIRASGRLYCWGRNNEGQLGDDSRVDRALPVEVAGGHTDWRLVSAAGLHTCGVRANGEAYCWGNSTFGTVGDGGSTRRLVPTLVAGGYRDWVGISAGGNGSDAAHSCGRRANGRIYCWGHNAWGELGIGTADHRFAPVEVDGSHTDWEAVAAGAYHSCGHRAGRLFCWGYNKVGDLGNGTTEWSSLPVEVSGLHQDWLPILSVRLHRSCAMRGQGTLYCWGFNYSGDLGDATYQQRETPTAVYGEETDWSFVTGGHHSVCGVRGGDQLYCWGRNDKGQLGDGTYDRSTIPVRAAAEVSVAAPPCTGQ